MSPIDKDSSSIKGKRIPGRPGRFDPSEPLHMTTRRAAKNGPFNGSPSINGSVEDDESPQASYDELRPVTAYSIESHQSAKSNHWSELPLPGTTPDSKINSLHSSEEKRTSRSKSKPISPPIEHTPSPSRKRKRSFSDSPPKAEDSLVDTSFEKDYGLAETDDPDADMVEVVDPADLSDRQNSPPVSPEDDDEDDDEEMAEGNETMEVTPAVSGHQSPATSASVSEEGMPLAKPLDAALGKIVHGAAQNEVADLGDDLEADVDADEGDDVYDQARYDDEGLPRRHAGGRRRAPHPNPTIEAAMRRQAQLRSLYRAITRGQKAVLAEIAQRTVHGLNADPELHTHALEYEDVRRELNAKLETRRGHLQAQVNLNTVQLQQRLEAEQRSVEVTLRKKLEDLQDAQLERLEYEMLRISRAAHLEQFDTDETEDEDDVIPLPKRTGYKFKRSSGLEAVYDSRSRKGLDTLRAMEDLERRYDMRKLMAGLQDDDDDDDDDDWKQSRPFTVMDSTAREAAVSRRENKVNMETLTSAATQVHEASQIPVIPNEQAHGLQLLGDLASRPSLRSSMVREVAQAAHPRETPLLQNLARPVPFPLKLHSGHRPSPIPLEMSPRTTQAMGDRFEMPPPLTPRQAGTPFIRSPEVMRSDHMAPSPPVHTPVLNGLHPSSALQSDSRPQSRRESLHEANHRSPFPTHHFIDRMREPMYGPLAMEARRNDHPLWRQYPSEQHPPPRSRPPSGSFHPFLGLFGGLPMPEDRLYRPVQDPHMRRDRQGQIKDESPPFNPLQRGPAPSWPEQRREPAGDPDLRDRPPSSEDAPKSEGPKSPQPRTASAGLVVNEFQHQGNQRPEGQRRQRAKGAKSASVHHPKTNKDERFGISRRRWSKESRKLSQSMDKASSVGSPSAAASSFAGSPIAPAAQPAPWQGPQPPPPGSPTGPFPPSLITPFNPQPWNRPPEQFPPSARRPSNESGPPQNYQHRNSFPPPLNLPGWIGPPQSPLFAIPPPQGPPPPGVSPEQYNRPFVPPPPPNYHPGPPHLPSSQTSQTSQPQPTPSSASFAGHFSGPPLAPAPSNQTFHPPGFRAAQPLPAFAQQQQQQQNNNSSGNQRRRTQSDVSNFPKFHPWNPPNGRRN